MKLSIEIGLVCKFYYIFSRALWDELAKKALLYNFNPSAGSMPSTL